MSSHDASDAIAHDSLKRHEFGSFQRGLVNEDAGETEMGVDVGVPVAWEVLCRRSDPPRRESGAHCLYVAGDVASVCTVG